MTRYALALLALVSFPALADSKKLGHEDYCSIQIAALKSENLALRAALAKQQKDQYDAQQSAERQKISDIFRKNGINQAEIEQMSDDGTVTLKAKAQPTAVDKKSKK